MNPRLTKALGLFKKNYWRLCFVPMTVIAIAMTGLFLFLNPNEMSMGLGFFINLTFSHCIGTTFFVVWSFKSFLPVVKNPWLRPLAALPLLLLAVFVGTALASLPLSFLIDIGIIDFFKNVWKFNLFISACISLVWVAYERLSTRVGEMADELKIKEIEEHKLLKLKSEAELKALQATINPHFLFNTLNSIASLISINPCKAETAVEKLSKIFRYSLRSSLDRRVSLPEEIEMVNTYLELEKLRLGNRLTYHIRMPDNADHVRLPGMLIQPLVENAIKHGIAPKVEGGNLKVEVHLDQNRCHILVEDDGVGWDEHSLDDPGHGLENIRERLNLAFEGKHEIKFYNRMGAVIEISFPLEK